MHKNEMTWQAMLAEAVGLVSVVVCLGLQIYYGVFYNVSAVHVLMNVAVLLLVYAGLTLLSIYPERVNGLTKEACSGSVRTYTIRMVRMAKLIFAGGLLFTSICDVMGKELPAACTVLILGLMVAVALYYEYRIIRILRERYKK